MLENGKLYEKSVFETAVEEFAMISIIERVKRSLENIKEVASIVGISDDVIGDFDKEFNDLVNMADATEEWFKKMRALEASILAAL